jgi:iron-sulfur cluster assembly protein
MPIALSDSAKQKMSELVATRDGSCAIRVGLRSGGCKGFEQFIELSATESVGDHIIDCEKFKILIDKKSATLLNGATLDWKTSLTESRFVFIFPDTKPSCSCGKSFSV